MFTKKQSMATAGVVTTFGAAIALGTFGATPATGAQLDFNFSTANGKTGSFTLNTSASDIASESGNGRFLNAVTNFEYSGVEYSAPLEVRTYAIISSQINPKPHTLLYVGDFNVKPLFLLDSRFNNLSLVNKLSENSADYSRFLLNDGSSGAFVGYRGGFEGSQPDPLFGSSSPVTSINVVPEPLTILGSGMALGFGALMTRQYSKRRNKI